MFENVTPLYSKLFGSADEFTLEHRFLNSTTLFICVFCFVACFVNLSINCGPIMTYGMLLLSAIYGYLYYLSRIQKYYIWPSRATVALILINCIQLWFMNGGSIGAGQYVIFPGLCASIVLVSTRFKIPIILFYAVLLALLLTIEHVYPEIIQVYNSADDRFIDIIITFTLSLLLTTIVLYTLSMNYYDHRRIIAKRNREIEIELELARNIQKSLLPEMKPASKALEMYGYFLPMDKVGGDFYDFYELESSIIVSIYDVSGHGVPAAFLGVIAKSALKDAVSKEQSTSSILSLVNREILNNSLRGNFVTSFLCSIDVISKKLKYCCAGHLSALLYRAEEKIVTRLNTQGKLLGCFPDAGLEEKETALRSGDRLFLYTDGITECTNWNKNMYGITSLIEFIEDNAGLSAEDFSEKLIDELQDFSHSSQLQDDVAMVIIDIK